MLNSDSRTYTQMIDIPGLKTNLGLTVELNASDLEEVLDVAKFKSYSANEYIFKEGDFNKNIYLIIKGVIRTYFVNDKGDEKTNYIAAENNFAYNYESLFRNKASLYFCQTLEPTEVLCIDFEEAVAITEKNPKLLQCRIQFYEYAVGLLSNRIHNLIVNSSKERYLNFIEKYPSLSQRVPNKYIANVLGITPVQLSRIRKQIATQKSS